MNITLRKATLSDAARVADILLASHKAFLAFAASPHTDEEIRAWVRDILLSSEDVTLALRGVQVVGVLAVQQTDEASWLTQLYLDPPCVGQGIGSQLLAHAVATLALPIRLYTFQQNTGARRFYERAGFVPIQFTDGKRNEERCPDVLYEFGTAVTG